MNEMQRNHKDTVFRAVFADKVNLLSLYNAVNGTEYKDPDELEIVTLENAVYMNMKNDISCVIDFSLNLYEHQSTVNPNIPLRDLFYVSKILQGITRNDDLYGSRQVKIPVPRFFMFYNGTREMPEQWEMRLSQACAQPRTGIRAEPMLELVVQVFNINFGKNEKLLKACRKLKEYAQYVEKVRRYIKEAESGGGMEESRKERVSKAIGKAIEECIRAGILSDFLKKNRAEALEMSWYEYNEELHIKNERAIAFEEGVEQERKRTEEQRRIAREERKAREQAEREVERLQREIQMLKS